MTPRLLTELAVEPELMSVETKPGKSLGRE